MPALRLPLLLVFALVFSACDVTNDDPGEIRRGFIERVAITHLPFTQQGGGGWDGGGPDEADVYVRLLGTTFPALINSEEDGVVAPGDSAPEGGTYVDAGEADLALVYTLDAATVPASDLSLYRPLRLEVKDDDSEMNDEDDVMALSQAFTLSDQIPSALPDDRRVTFAVTNDAGTMTAEITVRYAH